MEVSDKLSKLLSKKNQQSQLDKKLATSCQQFFTQSVEFRPASGPDSHLENLKGRYKPLNREIPMEDITVPMETSHAKDDEASSSNPISPKVTNPQTTHVDILPTPRRTLYSSDKLNMKWKHARGIGSGLNNMGNTCFLNSVLQCLTYTPPLYNYLMSGDHKQSCGIQGFCTMCEFQRHCTKVFNCGNGHIKPVPIVQNLRAIAKHFRLGRQEDAHEFLRYFIDGLQKSCLHGYPAKLDPHSKATTVVHQIFGGYHRSQVKCLQCMKTSNTYDPLLDVSLDIKNCNTILKALLKSIKPDLLEGDNSYACPFCKKMTKAQKRFTLQKLPKVLTVQLKRFDFNSMFGSKVNKNVDFPEHIDMRNYMSNTQGPSEWYKLFAVLVHYGFSSNSGHYYCYIRNSNGFWYCMNDSQVTQVSISTVLQQEAYLLFYIKDEGYSPPGGKTATPSSPGNLATKSHDQHKTSIQRNVKHDPNFLSTAKKQSGLDKTGTPLVRRLHKPTGIVPPSPKIIPARPSREKTSSPSLLSSSKTNGSLVQEFSIPIRKAAVIMPSEKVKVQNKVNADSAELPGAVLSKSDAGKTSTVIPSPAFVPRQIKAQIKLKKVHHVGSKGKDVFKRETPSRKLSPLLEAEEEEMDVVNSSDSSRDAIPLASSIPPLQDHKDLPPTVQATALAEKTILDLATSSPVSQTVLRSPDQSTSAHKFIGPHRQSPPPPSGIKMAEDFSTSAKVALVSPHSHTSGLLGSGSKPVARVRPSPHVTSTPDYSLNKDIEATPTSAKATSTVVTATPKDIKNDREVPPKLPTPPPTLSSPLVDSTTSGDVIVSPPGNVYGPDLPSDHVTSTLGLEPFSPKSTNPVTFEFGSSSKHSKKHKKKRYRKHSELEGVSPSEGEEGVSSSATCRTTEIKSPSSKDSDDFVKSSKQSKSGHHRDKHSHSRGDATGSTHSHHKHKKRHRGDSDEIDKTPPEDRRGRDKEAVDRRSGSDTARHSKNRKHSSGSKYKRRENSRYKRNRSRSPLSRTHSRRSRSNSPERSRSPLSRTHSRRSRSNSPGRSRSPLSRTHSHHRRYPPYTTPRVYSHRHRRHSHMSTSSGEKVKQYFRSRSRSPYCRRHKRVKTHSSGESGGERVKESPIKHDNVFSSPVNDLSKKQTRKKEHQSEERLASPERKRHKCESSTKDTVDRQQSNSTQSDVPVIVWDAVSKGDLVGNKWNGAKCSDSLEQLTSHSHSKIGGVVKSWDGGENNIDSCTVQGDEGQKWTRDNWDTELDMGKVKKVKRKIKEDFHVSNKFQDIQTKKNSQISTGNTSPDKHHHHKPHHHHKGHKGHHHH